MTRGIAYNSTSARRILDEASLLEEEREGNRKRKGRGSLCRGPKNRALASETCTPAPCTPRETQARNVTTDRARGALADGRTR